MKLAILLLFCFGAMAMISAQEFTREVGNYPGDPKVYHGAILATSSENFYWRGVQLGNFRALRQLEKANPAVTTRTERKSKNSSAIPALMVRVKAVGGKW